MNLFLCFRSVSLNEFTKEKLHWNEFCSSNFPGIQSEVSFSCSKIHHPVSFFTIIFCITFPHWFWWSSSFLACSLPFCFCIGEKKLTSFVAVLVSSGNANSCLTTGCIFLTFHSTGRFYIVLQIIVVCPLLIATVSCGNKIWLMVSWVQWAEKDLCF